MNSRPNLTYTLTREPLSPDEQQSFHSNLVSLGLDATVWDILNSTLATSTSYTVPKLLRAYVEKRLIGVALILQCRQGMKAFFAEPLATVIDPIGISQFVWNRSAVMVDHYSNPGFVVAGFELDLFVEKALDYLQQHFLFGVLLCDKTHPSQGKFVRSSLMDYGAVQLDSPTVLDDYFVRHKHLKRKLNKFGNKGGSIKIVSGALAQDSLKSVLHCLDQAALHSMGRTPFQDNYVNMSMQAFASNNPNVIHFLAYLNDRIVGYHSFVRSGNQLSCLSGGFDRTLSSSFHAYENLLFESMVFALKHKLTTIHYGSIINPTKAKMMQTYIPTELRFYSKFLPIRCCFPLIINNSFWSPKLLDPYTNLSAKQGLALVF